MEHAMAADEVGTPDSYLVAGCRPWNRDVYDREISKLPGSWSFAGSPAELERLLHATAPPRYAFFLHWSWRVPPDIVERVECVCFHMTDVPYGRGGSPLQHLILRGHRATKLSALRMTEELDAGPVYLKADLALDGSAEEIYLRATRLAARMLERIIRERPIPTTQVGEPVVFARRRPEESRMPALADPRSIYDFVRMLDAEGYPLAFIEHQGLRLEFSKARLEGDTVRAEVVIRTLAEGGPAS